MTQTDHRGLHLDGANDKAIAIYEDAIAQFQTYSGDPVAAVDEAIREAPDFAMAHILRAYLFITGTDARGLDDIGTSRAALDASPRDTRANMHLAAIDAFLDCEFETALERLEDILILWPHDTVALQTAHLYDFNVGDARSLRDRVARRLSAWTQQDPGYHALVGMHAFGLEECGDYERAEDRGRQALALNGRDCWAQHAVAHVMEMQGRTEDGIAWMTGNQADWATDSFFAVHNWWHLGLFHLEQGEAAKVLELYDGPISGGRSDAMLDMVDASAMLWRLKLRNIDCGDRWSDLADVWSPVAADGYYAFNDVHGMMALLGSGRDEEVTEVVTAMENAAAGTTTNAVMTAEIGLPIARGLIAYQGGEYDECIRQIRPIRARANRFGGSHAQRDVLDQTLIEAARRAGDHQLVQA
ncbi:MAG: tetratricopeptide repeat protein, partial [Rhodospirillaceae bacterium]|nr:tetratricopeptide repeat protein [Rhodospirillaceae bacterium]